MLRGKWKKSQFKKSLTRCFSFASAHDTHKNARYAQRKADELKAVSLQSAIDTVERLELKLTEFASKHQSEIKNDPVFRQRFLEMCAPLGVDPLTSSKKNIWNSMLGIGDFYHVLAVKVAEVCIASRSKVRSTWSSIFLVRSARSPWVFCCQIICRLLTQIL